MSGEEGLGPSGAFGGSEVDDAGGVGPSGLPYRPGAGVVLVNPRGLIFGGRRIDNPTDAWQMPQGGIDEGESPREAALREMGEEIGLPPEAVTIEAETAGWITYDLPAEMVGQIWKGRFGGQRQKWFLMRYDGPDSAIDIATAHAEFDQWRWMTADALIEKIVPFKRDLYRRIFAEFAARL